MAWFRTHSGQLIHAVGGLAAVAQDRGWRQVDDDQAVAEVTSGQAQARADEAAALSAAVDAAEAKKAAARDRKKTARKAAPKVQVELEVTKDHQPDPEVTRMVDDAIRDETPRR